MIDLNKGRIDKNILDMINILNIEKKLLKNKEDNINTRIEKIQSSCNHLLILSEKNSENKDNNGERCLICDKYSSYGFDKRESIVVNICDFKYKFGFNEHLKDSNIFYQQARLKVEEILKSEYCYSLEECKRTILDCLIDYNKSLKVKKLEKK